MQFRSQSRLRNRTHARNNAVVSARVERPNFPGAKRTLGGLMNAQRSHLPPETWHEPNEESRGQYRIIVQSPGPGFRHVVTPQDIRERLAELPESLTRPLHVVQLSRMTRKKKTFPLYGMQWGCALYLYPMEEGLIETFHRPPTPAQLIEARMYGGVWTQAGRRQWQLAWTESSIRDYYLNNILLHELGHLLDNRNTGYRDRERFAEWFAIEHGVCRRSRSQRATRTSR
jgi:hypothetical protein